MFKNLEISIYLKIKNYKNYMNDKLINKILENTEHGYDRMAEKFSGTRNFFWSDLEFIQDHIQAGDRVLDFGCGNGRFLEILRDKKIEYSGVDISQQLIDLAREKYPEFHRNFSKTCLPAGRISGQCSLAFPDNFFNKIVSIAVFHHLPDKQFRLDMIKELYRITNPGGEIIVTVWNLWQPKYRKYIRKNRWRKIFFSSKLDWSDCEIPFKNNEGKVFKRFHHAYTQKELTKIFSQAGFKVCEVRVVNNKNLVLIGKKI